MQDDALRTIKLIIEYDGTDFCGWQIQVNDRTVQAELERSLSMLTNESIRATAAGRTDSGVHALGQVVHFKTLSTLPLDAFVRGGNTRLPYDVRIVSAEDVDGNFHARYSAKARTYRYTITKRPIAVGRRYVWYYWNSLDVERMQAACQYILGSHNFKSFCQTGSDVKHHICDVQIADWQETDDQFIFTIKANRFLHNMVRILVGTMVEIGEGKLEPEAIPEILATQERGAAGNTAPAIGLVFVHVDY